MVHKRWIYVSFKDRDKHLQPEKDTCHDWGIHKWSSSILLLEHKDISTVQDAIKDWWIHSNVVKLLWDTPSKNIYTFTIDREELLKVNNHELITTITNFNYNLFQIFWVTNSTSK